jgi:hypothetical protein
MTLAPSSVERLCSGESYVRPVADTGVWFGFLPRSDVLVPGGCRLGERGEKGREQATPPFWSLIQRRRRHSGWRGIRLVRREHRSAELFGSGCREPAMVHPLGQQQVQTCLSVRGKIQIMLTFSFSHTSPSALVPPTCFAWPSTPPLTASAA